MSAQEEPNTCYCSCHTEHNVLHCFPCCDVCPACGRERVLYMRKHWESCRNYLMYVDQHKDAK